MHGSSIHRYSKLSNFISDIHFVKAKGHLHEELALVGLKDEDLPPGETYRDLGNVRADELATRGMREQEHHGYTFSG